MQALYYVIAEGEASEPDDSEVPGVYAFSLPQGYPAEHRASAVLDAFHTKIGIDCLDDFTFTVKDGDGNVIEEPDGAESYARSDEADFIGKVEAPAAFSPA